MRHTCKESLFTSSAVVYAQLNMHINPAGWTISVHVCVFVCSWVWARLQLRAEAVAIPTDLKTSEPVTSKYGGVEEKKTENVTEHKRGESTEGES